MWPDCPDDVLLAELSVIVSTGWDLPSRAPRLPEVRHLLLLAAPGDSLRPAQAAQRLLGILDEALRQADPETLSEDDATGCRILLGVHATYRTVTSPVQRRTAAAEYLIPDWADHPPSDPAGTFQRRHQPAALRLVLDCLHRRFEDDEQDYDIARVQRTYLVDAARQVIELRETAGYRILRDGVQELELVEAEPDPEGLVSCDFSIQKLVDAPPPVLTETVRDPTLPGYRRLALQLPRPYLTGEMLTFAWKQTATFTDQAPDWGRFWASVAITNDHYELTMTVTFTDDAELPDQCWWFDHEPATDLNEVGPATLANLTDLHTSRSAAHTWTTAQTQGRRRYGLLWCWFDGDTQAIKDWEDAAQRLAGGDHPQRR